MVVLDTNIVIDHLRQTNRGDTALMRAAECFGEEKLALSVVSIQELYEGLSTRDRNKEAHLLATIALLHILPYTYNIAQRAGEIARDLKGSIELADAAIAATAIEYEAKLLTLNKKHFRSIDSLVFIDMP